MRTVLVTGGAGYVGSHACKALAAAGWQPVVYDNLITGHRDLVRWGPLEEGDIGDEARLDAVFSCRRPQAVMHFAASSLVGVSMGDPAGNYRNNVAGSLAVLDAMRRHEVPVLVFSSSCAVYGQPHRLPITESESLRPLSPYGWSKLMVERLMADFGRAYGLRWAALRYFNAAGADEAGETGEDHHVETHLIPRALMAAAGLAPRLEIFGTDWPTPDGTCVRDYVHVADLARWHVAALERLVAGQPPMILNLGTGCGASVREVVAAVQAVTGRTIPVAVVPRRDGDPPVLVADPAQARRLLADSRPPAGLEAMVDTAWRWLQLRGGLA